MPEEEEPVSVFTRVFRAIHLPRRRREIVSEENPTPTNVQPGELLYDEENNKLYVGQDDESAVEVSGGGGGGGGGNISNATIDGGTY